MSENQYQNSAYAELERRINEEMKKGNWVKAAGIAQKLANHDFDTALSYLAVISRHLSAPEAARRRRALNNWRRRRR
jgi:hypothetical protein